MDLALPNLLSQPRAQLYSLDSTYTSSSSSIGRFVTSESPGQIIINFPNLPEEIDIVRSSEWKVQAGALMPDGFHIYSHTAPMEIPLTFQIHAFDDYSAQNGPETILQIAAKLSALQLPIITNTSISGSLTSQAPEETPGSTRNEPGKANASNPGEKSKTTVLNGFTPAASNYGSDFFFPPACVLNLMLGSKSYSGLGICCIGYIKSVGIKLRGPWLNSGQDDINRNLPSSAEFSFTFVHAPSYTNRLPNDGGGDQMTAQVGASQMRDQFYNTIDAVKGAGKFGYAGIKGIK